MKEISRQRRWQLKRQRLGLCICCGGERTGSKFQKCLQCGENQRQRDAAARKRK